MIEDVVAFLRARLDEDEQAARAATPGPWVWRHEHGEPWQAEPDGWLDYSGEYLAAAEDRATLFGPGMTPHADAVHIERHHPARVLARVKAGRCLFDMYDEAVRASQGPNAVTRAGGGPVLFVLDEVFRRLALEYADHPDYRPEWRPQ